MKFHFNMTAHFEAKLHGFRRTQDGVVISYVIHPADLSPEIALAPLGTRYMVAFAEIGDDEKPIDSPVAQPIEQQTSNLPVAGSNPAGATKDRKPFASLPLSQQAALRCNERQFWAYLESTGRFASGLIWGSDMAADCVRSICQIPSRADLNTNQAAKYLWVNLEEGYQSWLTTQRYAESAR